MKSFAANIRARAEALGLSNAEVARRVGVTERRYAHYIKGDREPNLATLVRIADVLGVTTDQLLGRVQIEKLSKRRQSLDRLSLAAATMSDAELETVLTQIEALATKSNRTKR